MSKLMGKHNRITEKRYNAAKVELKSPKDDAYVAAKYGFGMTTARMIRNTDNFYEYHRKGATGKKQRDHLNSTLADLREEHRRQTELEYLKYKKSSANYTIGFIIITTLVALLLTSVIIFLKIVGGS